MNIALDMNLRGNHVKVLPKLVNLPVASCRLDVYGDHPEWTRVALADGVKIGVMFLPDATEEDRNKIIDILSTSVIELSKPKTKFDLTDQQRKELDDIIRNKFLVDNPQIAASLGIEI